LKLMTRSHCGELCLSPCKGVTLPFNVAVKDLIPKPAEKALASG